MIGVDTNFLLELELAELPRHRAANALFDRHVGEPDFALAIVPQVLSEFVHIATDARRFTQPLSMPEALRRSEFWWNARESTRVFPTANSMTLYHEWMGRYFLGRKRVLDTMLATTLYAAGVRRFFTSNPDDFRVFSVFELLVP